MKCFHREFSSMMDCDVTDALELANQAYKIRLKKQKERRQRAYLIENDLDQGGKQPSLSEFMESESTNDFNLRRHSVEESPESSGDENALDTSSSDEDIRFISDIHYDYQENDFDSMANFDPPIDLDQVLDSDLFMALNEPFSSSESLHQHTTVSTNLFCQRLFQLFRSSKLSKTDHQKFLDLIRSGLPNPNNLPLNIRSLLETIQIDGNLFNKRRVCLLCHKDIVEDVYRCVDCPNSNDTNMTFIYESDLTKIVSLLVKRFWSLITNNVAQIRANNDQFRTNDIGFGEAYRHLLQTFSTENFVTGLLHLDGIGLCKSSKLKMWLFSMSIVELPALIRYRRHNMPVVSIWIGYQEPIASLWLQGSIFTLNQLKHLGKATSFLHMTCLSHKSFF